MALNLLEIVRNVRGRLGQPIPATVASSTDPGIIQCLGLLNEFLEDLLTRKYWQSNIIYTTFTITAAVEDQGSTDTLFPYGFEGILPDTFYNNSLILPVSGSLTAAEWSARKAMNMSGPLPAYMLRGNNMLFNPLPNVGDVYACQYYSSWFVKSNATVPVYRKYWLQDTDVCTVDDALPMAYLKWAWKKEKGLDYAEDFRKYETMVNSKGLRDTTKPSLSMNARPGSGNMGPGILVSPGSWPLA